MYTYADAPTQSAQGEPAAFVVRSLPLRRPIVVNTVVAWAIFLVLVYLAWRMWRYMRNSYRRYAQQKAEAFSNAVSSAVASGVANAISAAIADSSAAASAGVNVHIGDNLARFLSDNDDNPVYSNANRPGVRESDSRGLGSMSDATRHGELTSGRTVRPRIAGDSDSRNVRTLTVESGEIA